MHAPIVSFLPKINSVRYKDDTVVSMAMEG